MQSVNLTEAKSRARAAAKVLRAGCNPEAGAELSRLVLRDFLPPAGAVVAGFWPIRDEINILPLLHGLAERGYTLCLPETPAYGAALTFRKWQPGAELLPGRFGTAHPAGDVVRPDFLLVPLLAFDAQGNRLGYGGGHYDRTLAQLPGAFRLGCAYAAQEISAVPVEANDLKLHAVATELGVRQF